MPLTLSQLRTPVTQDQALQTMLDELEALGFNVTSWQSGSVQRTLLTSIAKLHSSATELVAFLADMAFNDTAVTGALTEFSDSHYDNQRIDALTTQGDVVLTGGAIGPPYTVAVGDIVAREPVTGNLYRNITAGTIPVSGTLTLSFEAFSAGTSGNVANNTITELVTTFVGVTVNNPDPGAGTWITRLGLDEELDATLRARNRTKWATLNFAEPSEAYVNLSLNADTDITRVTVDDSNPRGPGTLDVYIARSNGVAISADVTTVQAAIDLKRPVTADPLVIAATAQPVTVSGTIHVTQSLLNAAKQAEIEAAAVDYVNSLPIGGEIIPPGTTGFLVFSELIGAITSIEGVRRVNLTSPTADVSISGFGVATLSAPSFSYVGIT